MNEVQVNSQGNVQSVDFTSQEPMQPQRSSQTEMMVTRQAQEVQVAMLAAKKFPRDQVVAYNNIMRACQRRKLAESSMYEFPRGNEKITGPSIRLAEAISKEAVKKDVTVDILIEVNVGMEENKFGITVESAYEDIKEMAKLPNIAIKGLMTSAPFVENSEDNRKYFRQLKQLSVDIQSKNIDNVDMGILSMGMTNDYIVAIEEGATIVRVGTAIFGARNYNI